MYTKIGSPKHQSLVESGTASVIEVIEPTASEEEEFKKAIQDMNWSVDKKESPITIFPRDELRASILTTTSTVSNSNHLAMPVQVRSPTTSSSKTSSIRSRTSRYSSNGELSPTKRLLEMGIITGNIDDDAIAVDEHSEKNKSTNNKATAFLQKIAKKTKLKKRSSPATFVYANMDRSGTDDQKSDCDRSSINDPQAAEEHILPDSFDDDLAEDNHSREGSNHYNNNNNDNQKITNGPTTTTISLRTNKSSVSPSSRKSASSSTSKGSGSEDSGIGIPVKTIIANMSETTTSTDAPPPFHGHPEVNFRLGKIEEASVASSQASNNKVNKKVK